jgi:hypothetical protein
MNEVSLHRDDVITILQFINKYPDSEYVTVTSDSSSGIGSLIKANVKTILHGDFVTITKDIVDESGW